MNLAIYTLRSIAYALIKPSLFTVLIILGFVFYRKNKKTSIMQKMIIGESLNSPLELTLSQIVLGIFGGVIASLLLTYLGVMFQNNSGIEMIFLFSILLMIINPRFICFSYSGALLGAISLILRAINYYDGNLLSSLGIVGNPLQSLDIGALFTLVGVLHIVEGLLVMVDGTKGAIPVFTNKNSRILGGFALKRYWAMPIAVFLVLNNDLILGTEAINAPDWWPLINHNLSLDLLKTMVLGLMPFYGVIGYSSVTFTKTKKQKAMTSGGFIFSYGIILTLIAQIAPLGFIYEVLLVVFAPLAHEAMLFIQGYIEERGKPLFLSDEEGVCVLEVSPNSPAYTLGIKSGDKLLAINDSKVDNELNIYNFISKNLETIKLKIKDSKGLIKEMDFKSLGENKKVGIVFVPKGVPEDSSVVRFEDEKFRDLLEKLKNKDKEDDN